jgi:hypothetical protein
MARGLRRDAAGFFATLTPSRSGVLWENDIMFPMIGAFLP